MTTSIFFIIVIMNEDRENIIDVLSIDCLIFGFEGSRLHVLLVKHAEGKIKGQWALPGGFVRYDEDIDAAAYRILRDLTGVDNLFLEQLQAFGKQDRYPSKRVITIAYFALTKPENFKLIPGFTASDVRWTDANQVVHLPFDHKEILECGLQHLRQRVRYEPIGFNLLPEKFTLHQLQELYEAILNVRLDKPNFRRKIMKMNLLIPCEEKQVGVSHRAARLYRFDGAVYEKLQQQGFNFEF